MTIEGLEILAANLYKEAEEATPIIGGADKKDWMARKLEEVVETHDYQLNELLACDTIDEALDRLELWYDGRDDEAESDMLLEGEALNEAAVNPEHNITYQNNIDKQVANDDLYECGCEKDLLADVVSSSENRTTRDESVDENSELRANNEPILIEEEIIVIDTDPVDGPNKPYTC